ncbi:hypothetical protein AwErysi_00480 [Erysipelotrichaceae bacterium]|nr:hypothetical protein AwErysi_00480 [Erysipelotrichaceae bacterium]
MLNLKRTSGILFSILLLLPTFSFHANSNNVSTDISSKQTIEHPVIDAADAKITKQPYPLSTNLGYTTNSSLNLIEPQPLQMEINPFLNSNEEIVYSYAQLKTALEVDNGIDTIFLGADIQQMAGGITINTNKDNLIIDGINPQTQIAHTLTDLQSLSMTDTIKIVQQPTKLTKIEMKNIKIIGENDHGTLYIADAVKNITIRYSNIIYNGPKLIFNRYGTVEIVASTISIEAGHHAEPQEIGEVNHVILRGENELTHFPTNGLYGAFKFTQAGASINIISSNTIYETSGMLITPASFPYEIIISQHSDFHIIQTGNHDRSPIGLYGDTSFLFIKNSNLNISRSLSTDASSPLFDGSGNASGLFAAESTIILNSNQQTTAELMTIKDLQLIESELYLTQEKDISNYLIQVQNDLYLEESLLALKINGDSTNNNRSGFYQHGSFLLASSIFTFETNGRTPNYMVNLDSPLFQDSEFNIITNGHIEDIANGAVINVNHLALDNTYLSIKQQQNAGNAFNATHLSITNKSKILIDVNQFQGTQLFNTLSDLDIHNHSQIKILSKTLTNPEANHLKVNGNLEVKSGGSLQVFSESGMQKNLIQLLGTNRKFIVDTPLSIILGGAEITQNLVFGINPIQYSIDAQQATLHDNTSVFAEHNSLAQLPIFEFHKANYTPHITFDGIIAANAGDTSVLNSNYEATDSHNPSGAFTFSATSPGVLAIGDLSASIDAFNAGAKIISGTSSPGSMVELQYHHQGALQTQNILTDMAGNFVIHTLSVDNSPISIYSVKNYLNYRVSRAPLINPVLKFESTPDIIEFGTKAITNNTIFTRNSSFMVEILDTRNATSNWQLSLSVLTPLHSSKNSIPQAFMFKTKSGSLLQLGNNEQIIHTNIQSITPTILNYTADEGLLLRVDSGNIYSGIPYSGNIEWILSDAP